MKIDQIRKKQEDYYAEILRRDEEIQKLKDKANVYAEKMTEAKKSGDYAIYIANDANKRDAENKAKFLEDTKADFARASLDECKEAWQEYLTTYTKALNKQQTQLEQCKQDLKKIYLDMLKTQNEALKIREELASYVGVESTHQLHDENYPGFKLSVRISDSQAEGLRYKGLMFSPVDSTYLMASDLLPFDSYQQAIHKIVTCTESAKL